jgi:hypothetical protein
MTIEAAFLLVAKDRESHPYRNVWSETYLRLSLYVYGIKPNYDIPKDDFYRTNSKRNDPEAEKYTPIFDNEIFSRYPHDSYAQLNFRKSIASVDDMKSILDKFNEQSSSIIFQGNNFTVTTDDAKLQRWIEEVRIDGFEFYEWIKKVLYTKLFVDPNAWLAVVENHKEEIPQSEPADPKPYIIGSEEIKYLSDEGDLLITDWIGISPNKQVRHTNYKNESFLYYPHQIKRMPAVQLGGKFVRRFIWQSFIESFVGIANAYLQEKSDVAISKKTLAPRLQIIESSCPICNGKGNEDTKEGPKKCEKCSGSGKISLNLGDVVGVPESQVLLDGQVANLERYKYNTPDASYIEILSKDADKEFMRAEKALFIYRKETAASESSNNLDKQFEEKKIFFQNISERIYYLMTEMLTCVSLFLNYNDGNPQASSFTIDKPISFDLSTAEDLIVQYANEKKNSMPAIVVNSSENNYIKKIYGEDSVLLRKVQFLQKYDPFYGIDISTRLGIDPVDAFTHTYLSFFLELYVATMDNDTFMKKPFEEIWKALEPQIKLKADTMPTLL